MADCIRIEVADGIADVRLNRPAKRNALNLDIFEGLAVAIARLAQRQDIRAVVLSGEGDAFCAGIDMELLSNPAPLADLAARTHGAANLFQYAAWGWRMLPMPVIAAVHGVAFGGGLQVALGADLRVARPDARLSFMEGKWGLVPDMAGTLLLRDLVRDDVARDLLFTARQLTGEQGAALGLVNALHAEPREEALAIARSIAVMNPEAVRAAKRLLNRKLAIEAEGQLVAEAREQQALLAGGAVQAAVAKALAR
ncbi:crotonase/enoyl-CoA hydratase family protein [Sphingoaurantiacus capsulatus]|uniref:Crotonase/enoyl-CoA hydratase family protein n=1 Tax=Sphingoaurantiacus capsulatus TaxID=1771310 RepID=A0ABV7X7I5_9SPHN